MPRTTNPGHLAKLFSSAVFSAFLTDLERWEADGVTPERYEAGLRWLEQLTDVAATIPDGGLAGRKVYQRCEDIVAAYREWHESDDPGRRREKRRRLRRRVNLLATAYRARTKLLEDELDLTVVRSMYEATRKLILAVPDGPSAIGRVLERFADRLDRG